MRCETLGEKDERGAEKLARTLENVVDGGLERRMTTTADRAKPALELFELTFHRRIERRTRDRSHEGESRCERLESAGALRVCKRKTAGASRTRVEAAV